MFSCNSYLVLSIISIILIIGIIILILYKNNKIETFYNPETTIQDILLNPPEVDRYYSSFLYTNRPYYTEFSDRILCMSKFLFEVQQKID
jgi:amino acid transporter